MLKELRKGLSGWVKEEAQVAVLGNGRKLPLTRIASGFDAAERSHVALYAAPADEGLIVNQRLRVQWPVASP
mgnify:CR=1 FL=1